MASHEESQRRIDFDLTSQSITLGRILVPVLLILIWKLISMVLPGLILGPLETLNVIREGFSGTWGQDLAITMRAQLVAFVLASVGGIVIGALLGLNDFWHDVLEIYIVSLYSVPKVVLYPIFLFIFQISYLGKMSFAFFHGIFPMTIIVMAAVKNIDDIYINVGRSLRLSRWQMFRYISLPTILIQLVVGLRLAFNLTFLGIILAELFASKSGLGLLLQHALGSFNMEVILSVVVVLMSIAFIVNMAFYYIQRHLENRWNLSVDQVGI